MSAFAGTPTVIVFDQQGHSHTPDTPRELSYPQFADDATALLRARRVECADVRCYSQNGGVALQFALRHPTLVNKLVTLSATYRRDGCYPAVVQSADTSDNSRQWAGTPVEKAFFAHTPDATALAVHLEKVRAFGKNDQYITNEEMRSISAKTMVIAGDTDDVRPEHTLAMVKLRGGGDATAAMSRAGVPAARLVILPTTHVGIFWESAVLVPMVSAFLDDVTPTTPDLF